MTNLPPDNLPPATPDPLEAELAALSKWDGPAPAPRPWENAADQTQGWRLYLHRPLPYVAAAAAILIFAVVFAGLLPTMRSSRQLKLTRDLSTARTESTDLAAAYKVAPTEAQLQLRNMQDWKDSNARNIREQTDNMGQNSPMVTGGLDGSGGGGGGAFRRGESNRNGGTNVGGRGDADRRTRDYDNDRAKAPEKNITVKPDPAELEKKSEPAPSIAAPPPPAPAAAPASPAAPGAAGNTPAKEEMLKTKAPAENKQDLPAPARGPAPAGAKVAEPRPVAPAPQPAPTATPLMDAALPVLAPTPTPAPAPVRSVIQRANQELLVPDVRAAVAAITTLVDPKSTEFIEQQVVTGDDRKPQTLSGTLVLRVTHERIAAVRAAVGKLGRITTDTLQSEDVTEQIVDLGARLRNERRLEAELLKTIEERNKDTNLDQVMKARESLSVVRQNIERLAAQNENLAKQVSLATLAISVRHDDVEAAPPPIPTAPDKIKQAANQGSTTLTNSIAGIVEFLIGGLVWWVLIGVIVIGSVVAVRRANRKARSEPPPSL